MTKPKISIIVPVYNTEKYLSRCVESIIAQTFRDIEIILVDDGSQDGSGKLCDEFALRDQRVRVLHQKNAGVSAARNAGIEAARGEWLGFVDSDDWIDAETYSTAYKTAIEQNADMVVWGFCDTENLAINKNRIHGFVTICDVSRVKDIAMNSSCASLYSKELLFNRSIRFPIGIKFMEDTFFAAKCYLYATKIFSIQNLFYHYFDNKDSSTHSMSVKKIIDGVEVIKALEKFVQQENKTAEWKPFFCHQKIEAKNRFLFTLDNRNFRLFRNTFPEVNTSFLHGHGKFTIVYLLIFLRLDFLADVLIKLQKWLHRNDDKNIKPKELALKEETLIEYSGCTNRIFRA